MKVDWNSASNDLILNPRLDSDTARLFQSVWKDKVQGRFTGHIGLVTSGSTGDARGRLVLLSKKGFLVSASAVNERLQSTWRDIWLKALPDFHVGGLSILARAHLSGAQVKLVESEKWSPAVFFNALSATSASLASLVPTQLFDLVNMDLRAPPSLRVVVIGGGKLERALHDKALSLNWPVLPSYGLTECSSQVATAIAPNLPTLMSLSHVRIRIGEDDRIEISSAALLSGEFVFRQDGGTGVVDHEELTFIDPKADGWFMTEDRGQIESDGSLTVLGRLQDFVKIGGESVVLSRLEQTAERLRLELNLQAATTDFAVLAVQDERLGAKLVLVADRDSSEIQSFISQFNERVLPFERIRSVHFIGSLPRSALGKILRAEALRKAGMKPA